MLDRKERKSYEFKLSVFYLVSILVRIHIWKIRGAIRLENYTIFKL